MYLLVFLLFQCVSITIVLYYIECNNLLKQEVKHKHKFSFVSIVPFISQKSLRPTGFLVKLLVYQLLFVCSFKEQFSNS